MKKNTIHRKSHLIEAKALVNTDIFYKGKIYCFCKDEFNDWTYTDDNIKKTYRLFISHIRNEELFEILRQC